MATEIVCLEDPLTCGKCGAVAEFLDFDESGACPGNVFCLECGTEIDVTTGAPAQTCGKCRACVDLAEHLENERIQQGRLF